MNIDFLKNGFTTSVLYCFSCLLKWLQAWQNSDTPCLAKAPPFIRLKRKSRPPSSSIHKLRSPLLLSTREQWIILATRASCHEHPWIRDSTIISLLYVLKSCSLMKNTCHLRLKLIFQIEGTQLKTDVWTEGLYYDGPIVNAVLSTSLGIMLLKFFIRSLVLTKHLRIQNRTLQHFEKPNGIRTR